MALLSGRIAIVTGAGRMRGIGRAIAIRLAADGAAVVVSAVPRSPESLPPHEQAGSWRGAESVRDEIVASGGTAIALDCDVTQADQVEKLIQQTSHRLGVPDAIVNNAGSPGGAGASPIIYQDEAAWQQTLDVNLNGSFLVSKFSARAMVEAGRPGAIVNIASLAGRFGIANYGAYCASKFAVVGFTQQLALELARSNIRVNGICPGIVATDMMSGTWERASARSGSLAAAEVAESALRAVPMRRAGLPHEQAAVVAFLLSDQASYITGQMINVDGGVRMD